MRLTDLHPRWLYREDVRVGFMFKSPKPRADGTRGWQTCFFSPTTMKQQWAAGEAALGDANKRDRDSVQYCEPDCGWSLVPPLTLETVTFENMSVTPSLDGSKGGNWHGFITNGEIVGGV